MVSRYPTNLAYKAPEPMRVLRYLTAADFRAEVALSYQAANVNQRLMQRFASKALRSWAGLGRVAPWLALGMTLFDLYELYEAWNEGGQPSSFDAPKPGDDYRPAWVPASFPVPAAAGWKLADPWASLGHPYLVYPLSPGHYHWSSPFGPIPFEWYMNTDYSIFEPYLSMKRNPPAYVGPAPTYSHSYGYGVEAEDLPGANIIAYGTYIWTYSGVPSYPPVSRYPSVAELAFPPVPARPVTLPLPSTEPEPLIWSVDPLSRPVNAPEGVPSHVPYPLIPHIRVNPWRAPEYQRQHSYGESAKPARPSASLPLLVPAVAISGSPDAAARAPRLASYHSLTPPSGGDKERKLRTAGASSILLWGGRVTEAVDTLQAVYYALPRKYWEHKPTPQRMLYVLYQHWDELSLSKAVENLILEQLSDLLYGKLGQGVKRLSRRVRPHGRLPIGFQAGPAM